MDPNEQRVVKVNKEIERTLFVNLALQAEVESVQERLERVRKDRELLLAKVRSFEVETTSVEATIVSSKPIESGKRSINTSSKVVKKKRYTQGKKP